MSSEPAYVPHIILHKIAQKPDTNAPAKQTVNTQSVNTQAQKEVQPPVAEINDVLNVPDVESVQIAGDLTPEMKAKLSETMLAASVARSNVAILAQAKRNQQVLCPQ